jgi:cytochrome c oxidase assembly factor CtaG
MLYVFLQMPQNSFLAVSIYGAEQVIFPHYRTLSRTWGPSPALDQAYAGVIMWVGGDVAFLTALAFIAYGWVKYDEREAKRTDRRLARERAERALAKEQQNSGAPATPA